MGNTALGPLYYKYTRGEKIIAVVMIASSFLTLWAYLYSPILDGDIWFHLLYGRYMIEHHTLIPDHTIYTWTPANNSIYCAWIGQLIYYFIYKFSGYPGIIVLRYISASLLFVAILHLARQRNTLYNPIVWFSATLSILAMAPAVLDKPEAFSLPLMTLFVLNWYKIKQLGKNSVYLNYLFPLLMIIWVNTHGAFLFGCIFLLCIGLGETINQIFYAKNSLPKQLYLHLCIALILSAGATLVTPYGYNYIHQLFLSLFDKQLSNHYKFVAAYARTFDLNMLRVPLFAYPAVGLLALVFVPSLRKKQLDFVPIVSNLVFAFIFTRYTRTMYLWAPVFSLCVTYYASGITISHQFGKKLLIAGFVLASFTLSGWILYQEEVNPTKERWLDFGLCEFATVDEEISFITKNYPNAKVANIYDHGSYMLWKMWPKTKVMIDARYFPFQEWFQDYIDFEKGKNVEDFIQKYPFDVIEVKHSAFELVHWFNNRKDWVLAFYGKGAAVFVRSDLARSDKSERGKSLENILAYGTGLNVLNTSLKIKDWEGSDIILATMKRKFTLPEQQKQIAGHEYNKIATQLYYEKDYAGSITNIEKAIEKKVLDKELYAAALLNRSLEEWRDGQQDIAIRHALKSYLVGNTIPALYDIALMAWQMDTTKKSEEIKLLHFTDKEREILTKWREILEGIAQQKTKLLPQYQKFADNADNIVKGHENIIIEFIQPDWI
jgi:hypothetical protein